MITGEPVPSKAERNVWVGPSTRTASSNSALSKVQGYGFGLIIALVEEAQGSRPPIQRIADRAVTYFIPTIQASPSSHFVYWYFVARETLLFSFTALISVLVVACPCALGLQRRLPSR